MIGEEVGKLADDSAAPILTLTLRARKGIQTSWFLKMTR